MSKKNAASDFVRGVAGKHLGSNIRSYKWSTYLDEVSHNMLGYVASHTPVAGTVVDQNEVFTLIKEKPSKLFVIESALLPQVLNIGEKVELSFYKPLRFDGTAADGADDPAVNGCKTFMIGGSGSQFPVTWPDRYRPMPGNESVTEIKSIFLQQLIEQLEKLNVDGGRRKAVNVLIDAGAKNLRFVDVDDDSENIIATPPAVIADVSNSKFTGTVEINYDRASDYYRVILSNQNGVVESIEDIFFESLPEVLIRLLDDGSWKIAKLVSLKKAPKAKLQIA